MKADWEPQRPLLLEALFILHFVCPFPGNHNEFVPSLELAMSAYGPRRGRPEVRLFEAVEFYQLTWSPRTLGVARTIAPAARVPECVRPEPTERHVVSHGPGCIP